MDGSCKPSCSWEMCGSDGLTHLAKPDQFFKNDVVTGSSWHSTHVIGSWMTIKSHTNRDRAISVCKKGQICLPLINDSQVCAQCLLVCKSKWSIVACIGIPIET